MSEKLFCLCNLFIHFLDLGIKLAATRSPLKAARLIPSQDTKHVFSTIRNYTQRQ